VAPALVVLMALIANRTAVPFVLGLSALLPCALTSGILAACMARRRGLHRREHLGVAGVAYGSVIVGLDSLGLGLLSIGSLALAAVATR
jgi:hypothetical protein